MDTPPPVQIVADTATFTRHLYQSSEGARAYWLFVPGGVSEGTSLPLVVLLHGCTQDAADVARGSRLNQYAEAQHFLVLYPEQPAAANPQKCWNWFVPEHQQRGAGEPALIEAMTRQVMAGRKVDPRRVFLAGISAGGAMAVLTALDYPELFAALAVHSGIQYRAAASATEAIAAMKNGGPAPGDRARLAYAAMGPRARMVPAMLLQGSKDPSVQPANLEALVAQFRALAELAGAGEGGKGRGEGEREETEQGKYRTIRTVYRDALGNSQIESWMIEGLAHAWSGGSPEGTWTDPAAPEMTREIVRFLLSHPMK